jgi:sec-independent protein translocase protein TatB
MNLGMPEMLFIFLLALIVFGPKRLPELARQFGKIMAEFKRATNDFKYQIENEIEQMETNERNEQREKSRTQQLGDGELTILPPPPPGSISSSLATGSGIPQTVETPPSGVEEHDEASREGHAESKQERTNGESAQAAAAHVPEQLNLPTEDSAGDAVHREHNVI